MDGPPRLQVRLFGLLGPNGPLPLHLTEYARERLRHAGDPTFSRFLDCSIIGSSRCSIAPGRRRSRTSTATGPTTIASPAYVGALRRHGAAGVSRSRRAARPREVLSRRRADPPVANAEGLAAILQHFFRVPVRDRGVRRPLADAGRARAHAPRPATARRSVAAPCSAAGSGTGSTSSGCISGPLTLAQYEGFLPGGTRLQQARGLGEAVSLLRAGLGRAAAAEAGRGAAAACSADGGDWAGRPGSATAGPRLMPAISACDAEAFVEPVREPQST